MPSPKASGNKHGPSAKAQASAANFGRLQKACRVDLGWSQDDMERVIGRTPDGRTNAEYSAAINAELKRIAGVAK
jgi:hypothetical protein